MARLRVSTKAGTTGTHRGQIDREHLRCDSGMTLAGVAAISGCAYVWWLRAPVVDTVSLVAWRVVGLVTAASIGGIGAVATGSWVRVGIALSIGVLTGAAWSEWWLNDASTGLIDSFVAAVVNQGRSFLLPCVAAGLTGAFATAYIARWRGFVF